MVNQHESEERVTRENVLALDIATHTGYYSMHGSGTWNFTESMRRNNNKQHAAFRNTLIEFISQHNIKVIVAEDVSVNNHFTDTRKLSEFRGILMEICDTLDLPEPTFINPKTVKKWATGNGNADKEMMMRFCKMRWKTNPVDDNEADATHIFFYYIKKFNL
ncbi:MAG: crossover junction endodeoxyribonuclease RuvC [Clostridia bacterium]|nr:crossover junction endodeoxyribonuclease RuvC [Clostridia bacterium]